MLYNWSQAETSNVKCATKGAKINTWSQNCTKAHKRAKQWALVAKQYGRFQAVHTENQTWNKTIEKCKTVLSSVILLYRGV